MSKKSSKPLTLWGYLSAFTGLRYRHRVLIARRIVPFTWPILVELICVVLMGMISTILVSRISKDATAAVGITESLTFIVLSLLTAVALGGSVLIAHSFSRHDRTKSLHGASHVMYLSVSISLVSALLMAIFAHPLLNLVAYGADPAVIILAEHFLLIVLFSYPALAITLSASGILRAVGNSRAPASINIVMNLFNIALSYPLIYGIDALAWSGLSMQGAALGLTISRWLGAIMILFSLTHNRSLRISIKSFFQPFNLLITKEILAIGLPASIESLMFNIGKLITQIMVAGMGTVAMAGNVITFSALLLINIPGNAIATASTILIGQRLGQNRPHTAQTEIVLLFSLASFSLVLLSLLSVPFARSIAQLYTEDVAVIEVVVNLIILNALMMPIWAASFVLPYAFKGGKDVKYSMWVAILSMWGCRIVLGYFLGIYGQMGIYGIWLGMFADWWMRGLLFLHRMITQQWLETFNAPKNRE